MILLVVYDFTQPMVVALESDYSRIILNANLTVNIESNYGIYFRPYRDNRTGNNEFAV